jgi:hypothetical protein
VNLSRLRAGSTSQNSSFSDSISPPPPIPPISSSRRPGIIPETLEPIEPAVSRTCSTTRLITLGFEAARVVLLLRGDALRFGAARLAVRRFAAVFFPPRRAAARRREDFFELRERFDEDFVDLFLEEDRFLDAMRFLLFVSLQSGLM